MNQTQRLLIWIAAGSTMAILLFVAGCSVTHTVTGTSVVSVTKILILSEPQSATAPLSNKVSFAVDAIETPPTTNGLSYQWQVNTNQLDGENFWTTEIPVTSTQSTLTFNQVSFDDVGYYRVIIKGGLVVTSQVVALQVYATSSALPIGAAHPEVRDAVLSQTVFGTPVVHSSEDTCPGKFSGYMFYSGNGTWGWKPVNPNPTDPSQYCGAVDTNNGQTAISASGTTLGDIFCTNRGALTMQPAPYKSQAYQFFIYFSSAVPKGHYAITFTNLH